MSIIVDLLLIFILGFGLWSGYRKGLIISVLRVAAMVVAFIVASIIASTYSEEFVAALEPFIDGMVDSAYTEVTEEYDAGTYDEDYLDDEDATEDYIINIETLKAMGLTSGTAEDLLESINETLSTTEDNVRTVISDELSSRLAYVIVYAIAFILVVIIFNVIGNIINLAFKLPGLRLINDIGGAVLGFGEALVIVLLIAWLLGYLGIIIPDSFMEKSIFLKWLMNHNIFTSLIG